MRIDKLTSKLQNALADAQSLAVGRGHNEIHPQHLLRFFGVLYVVNILRLISVLSNLNCRWNE